MVKIKCQVCGTNKNKIKYKIDDYIFLKCKKCGLVFLDQEFTKENISDIYNKGNYLSEYKKYLKYENNTENLNQNYFDDAEHSIKKAEIKYTEMMEFINQNEMPLNKKFLDVGCAAGYLLNAAQNNGWEGYGMEICEEGCEFAKNKFNINIIARDLLDVPNQYSNYFDFISLIHVLEHLNDPNINLQKLREILKKDGYLFIEVPNIKSVDSLFFKYLIRTLQPPHHLFAYNYNNLQTLLENNGFKVVSKKVFFSNAIGSTIKNLIPFIKTNDKDKNISSTPKITNNNADKSKKKNTKIKLVNAVKSLFPGTIMIVVCKKL